MSRRRRAPSATLIALELALGLALLSAATIAGLLFVRRPWENRFDVWGYTLLPADPGSRLFHDIADIGSLPVLLVVIAVAIAASIWRDPARALACALGPVAAVLITEQVAKPLVGRHVTGGLGFSYPSGTVTAASALVVVVLLASPALLRPLVTVLGVGVVAAVSVAVVAMRWHYPTDALGGFFVGAGAVFTLDALFHLPGLLLTEFDGRRAARSLSDETPRYLPRV